MNKCKYLVFGAGQVAGFIQEYFGDVIVSSADVTKLLEIERDIKKYKPKYCINTAAMTSLEFCELNKLKTFEINTLGALNVWNVCKIHKLFMCHFSSGCIFSSRKITDIYDEEDTPNPESYYSWTKVWSENLLGTDAKLLIIRPRVVISSKVDARNTISKWLTFSHFIDDQNSVTILEDLMPVLKGMINKGLHGTFNVVNKGTISPLDAAYLLKKIINKDLEINKTSLAEVNKNLISKRVSTILTGKKLEKAGFKMPDVHESLPKIIKMYKDNLSKGSNEQILEKVKGETKYRYTLKNKKPSTFLY
jgi:dTDP-4-dehydrorhamnose reductase